jgi:MoxR-like ATPase
VQPVLETAEISAIGQLINSVYMDEKLKDYIVDLVFATRSPEAYHVDVANYIQFGASPRATIFLSLAARAYAFLQGRAYVTPQDVKTIAPAVLRHRILLTYEAEAEDIDTDQIIGRIFDSVEVP